MSEDGSARPGGGAERFGILIYTATAGAQGTLGGLVGTAPRIADGLLHIPNAQTLREEFGCLFGPAPPSGCAAHVGGCGAWMRRSSGSSLVGKNWLEAFDAMIGEGGYAILTDGVDAQAASEVE